MAKDVIMPALGMTQETGVLIEWYKSEGDTVKKGEPLMLIETDKTTVEIEASANGTLSNVEISPGDEVPVGTKIAILLSEGENAADFKIKRLEPPASASTESVTYPAKEEIKATPVAKVIADKEGINLSQVEGENGKIRKADVLNVLEQRSGPGDVRIRTLGSPKAKHLARENDLPFEEIKTGTGPNGAVIARDVFNVLDERNARVHIADDSDSIVHPTSRMWQVMAKRLTESWQTIPHFYLETEACTEQLEIWRDELVKRLDIRVTLSDLLVKLTAKALSIHPTVNGKWVDNSIHLNKNVNVGLAVAVDDGLLVPVIHQANNATIREITTNRIELVTSAKDNSLTASQMSGGTFTISNLGMLGVRSFSAIVNPPQAAILAVGKSEDKFVAVNGQPVLKRKMSLTLSCDHRVIDGATGARFLQTLVGLIESPLSVLD